VLLDKGADINARTPRGFTALMAAANKGLVQTVRLLIERGADLSIRYEDGRTALDFARQNGQQAVITILEGAGRGGS
jgi:uncharacterized protein